MQRRDVSISELDELKLLYFEVLDGCSFDLASGLYIKHLSEKDSSLILRKRAELFHFYSSEGVPHESELLKNAIENEEWSKEKEERILELKYLISDNEKNIHNIIPQQRSGIEAIIEQTKKDLMEMLYERKHILGRNIEDLIDDDVNDYVVYLTFYKDAAMTKPLADSYDEFQNWDMAKISELNIRLAFHYRTFSETKLRCIAALPMFLNKLGYSKDNIQTFLGKPVMDFTHNQNFVFSLGIRNVNLLSTAKGSPPDLNLDATIHDAVKWYDLQHSLNLGKKNSQE